MLLAWQTYQGCLLKAWMGNAHLTLTLLNGSFQPCKPTRLRPLFPVFFMYSSESFSLLTASCSITSRRPSFKRSSTCRSTGSKVGRPSLHQPASDGKHACCCVYISTSKATILHIRLCCFRLSLGLDWIPTRIHISSAETVISWVQQQWSGLGKTGWYARKRPVDQATRQFLHCCTISIDIPLNNLLDPAANLVVIGGRAQRSKEVQGLPLEGV